MMTDADQSKLKMNSLSLLSLGSWLCVGQGQLKCNFWLLMALLLLFFSTSHPIIRSLHVVFLENSVFFSILSSNT